MLTQKPRVCISLESQFFFGGGGGVNLQICLISITTEPIKSSFKVIITVGMSDANIS